MAKPNSQRRGSSKAGRPRKDGDRFPNGKLRPEGHNQILVDQRNAMCDDPNKTGNPLDLALAHAWITEREHRAGRRYAETYRACGFGVKSTTASAALEVDVESELTRLTLAQMPDAMIAQAWDNLMNRQVRTGPSGNAAPLERWKHLNAILSPPQRRQVWLVCVMDSWPQWVVQRLAGRDLRKRYETDATAERRALTPDELAHIYKRTHSSWEKDYAPLVAGLRLLHAALNPPQLEREDFQEPLASPAPPRAHVRKREEITRYVDEEGTLIREVVRRVPV